MSFVVDGGNAYGGNDITDYPSKYITMMTPGGLLRGGVDMFGEKIQGYGTGGKIGMAIVVFLLVATIWVFLINGAWAFGQGIAFTKLPGIPANFMDMSGEKGLTRCSTTARADYTALKVADDAIKKSATASDPDKAASAALLGITKQYILALNEIGKHKKIVWPEWKEAFGGAARGITEISPGIYSQGFGGGRRDGPEFEDVPNYILRKEDQQQDALNLYTRLKSTNEESRSWSQFWADYQAKMNYGYGSTGLFDNIGGQGAFEVNNTAVIKGLATGATGRKNEGQFLKPERDGFRSNNPYGVQGMRVRSIDPTSMY
jgi:hypothetical protein